jgi:hypothetical protein
LFANLADICYNGFMDEAKAVEFEATVKRVRTLEDGSVDVTLNLPSYCLDQAALIMHWQNELVHGLLEKVSNVKESDHRTISRTKAKQRKQQGGTGLQ